MLGKLCFCIMCTLLLFVISIAFVMNQQNNIYVIDNLLFKILTAMIICAFVVICGLTLSMTIVLYEMKKENNQKNFCGECGCSCTCNANCDGDVQKCTSRKAIEKGCTHCCGCWHYPFAKKYAEERDSKVKSGDNTIEKQSKIDFFEVVERARRTARPIHIKTHEERMSFFRRMELIETATSTALARLEYRFKGRKY